MIALLCKPDLPVGTAATELGNLNSLRVTACQVAQSKWGQFAKGKVGVNGIMGSRVKAAIRIVWLMQT